MALSYAKWYADSGQGMEHVASEHALAAQVGFQGEALYPLTGTADALVTQDGRRVVLDWKTSKRPVRDHIYQVAAYARMAQADAAQVIYLSKTHKRGKATVIELAPAELAYGWYPVVMGAMRFYGFPLPGADHG